jgi:hypothetical protein
MVHLPVQFLACVRDWLIGRLRLPNPQYCFGGIHGQSFPWGKAVTQLGRGALRWSGSLCCNAAARWGQWSNRGRQALRGRASWVAASVLRASPGCIRVECQNRVLPVQRSNGSRPQSSRDRSHTNLCQILVEHRHESPPHACRLEDFERRCSRWDCEREVRRIMVVQRWSR